MSAGSARLMTQAAFGDRDNAEVVVVLAALAMFKPMPVQLRSSRVCADGEAGFHEDALLLRPLQGAAPMGGARRRRRQPCRSERRGTRTPARQEIGTAGRLSVDEVRRIAEDLLDASVGDG